MRSVSIGLCFATMDMLQADRSLRLLQQLTSGGTGAAEVLLGGWASGAASPRAPDLRVVRVEDFREDGPRAGTKARRAHGALPLQLHA